MRNCPDLFYKGCSNALKKCRVCCAGEGNASSPLYYSPRNEQSPSVQDHPASKKDLVKSKRIKEARKWEWKEATNLGKANAKSGSVHHDGDARYTLNGREVRVELKDRGKKKSFTLSLKELEKGRRQGVEVYGLRLEDEHGRYKTVYLLDETLFKEILDD